MKKLYIPTSSLNFNNILSSESISPKSFYSKRNFGIKRFETVRGVNGGENCIVLYEKQLNFYIPESDLEEHPLLIEISVDDKFIARLQPVQDGVYLCDFTIYLNPWNTKFIFFSEEDKKITLSMSDSSLEIKPNLYLKKLSVITRPEKEYGTIDNVASLPINENEIRRDFRINRLKGFLYGYYIGALLSTTQENVESLNVYRQIYNIFVAVVSSGKDCKPTSNQDKQLDKLFGKLSQDKEWLRNTFYTKILRNSWIYKGLIKRISPIEDWMPHQGLEKKQLLKSLAQNGNTQENKAIKLIEKKILEIENEIINNNSVKLSVSDKEVIVSDCNLKEINSPFIKSNTDKNVFISWINGIFLSEKFSSGKIDIEKSALTDDLTYKAKEIYGDKWIGSSIRKFLNDLRNHLAGKEFDYDWQDNFFSSIASFILKGEDWDRLLKFMQSKGMYDYKLAFALYGAFKGFANLERDFTDILYSYKDKDRNYMEAVYNGFHSQLFGENINFAKEKPGSNPMPPEKTEMLKDKVWKIARQAKKKLEQKEIEGIQYALDYCENDSRRFIELLDNQISTRGKVFSNLQKEFYPDYQGKTKKQSKNKKPVNDDNLTLFSEKNTNKQFYNDDKAYEYIKQLDFKTNDNTLFLKNDLSWFQNEYKKGTASKYYSTASRNNSSVIKSYYRHLEKEKDKNKHSEITDEFIAKICNILQKHYE